MKLDPEEIDALAKCVAGYLAPLLRPAAAPNPLLTCAEAAEQLRVSGETVRLLVHAGKIQRAPGVREIRIRQSALDTYAK